MKKLIIGILLVGLIFCTFKLIQSYSNHKSISNDYSKESYEIYKKQMENEPETENKLDTVGLCGYDLSTNSKTPNIKLNIIISCNWEQDSSNTDLKYLLTQFKYQANKTSGLAFSIAGVPCPNNIYSQLQEDFRKRKSNALSYYGIPDVGDILEMNEFNLRNIPINEMIVRKANLNNGNQWYQKGIIFFFHYKGYLLFFNYTSIAQDFNKCNSLYDFYSHIFEKLFFKTEFYK